jgi:16S rRNA (guanine(966)-N(2))-methyltransferase RsmD
VIGERVEGARVLDAFAGTGAVGLEAVSRGAARATFVERDRGAVALIEANVRRLGAGDACMIVRGEFARAAAGPFDIVWLDPPYEGVDVEAVLTRAATLVVPTGIVVLEHSRRRTVPDAVATLRRTRLLIAGDSALSFFAPAPI